MVALARTPAAAAKPAASAFAADVLAGLSATPKRLPPKYFYDAAGSQLFERITELPEYYPTRCEMKILRDHGAEIAKLIPPGAALVEFGSGSSKKARILLRAAPPLAAYVPVDICAEMLEQEAAELRPRFPAAQGAAGGRRYLPGRSSCRPSAASRRRASDFFPARPSAISSRTRRRRSCATPPIFWAPARR